MPHSHKRPQPRAPSSSLPFLLVTGGIVLFAVMGYLLWQGNASPKVSLEVQGAPALKADREQVDLGEVKLGQTVQVSFQIANVGDQPLRFAETPYIEVKEGC